MINVTAHLAGPSIVSTIISASAITQILGVNKSFNYLKFDTNKYEIVLARHVLRGVAF